MEGNDRVVGATGVFQYQNLVLNVVCVHEFSWFLLNAPRVFSPDIHIHIILSNLPPMQHLSLRWCLFPFSSSHYYWSQPLTSFISSIVSLEMKKSFFLKIKTKQRKIVTKNCFSFGLLEILASIFSFIVSCFHFLSLL